MRQVAVWVTAVTVINTSIIALRADTLVEQCLQQARLGSKPPGYWTRFTAYVNSLARNPDSLERARFLNLRAKLVDLEVEKSRLISVIQDHLDLQRAATPRTAGGLSSNDIPDILKREATILAELSNLADSANPFAAETSWKNLTLALQARSSRSLCVVPDELQDPISNKEALQKLLAELRSEYNAISKAEEALAAYIREKM